MSEIYRVQDNLHERYRETAKNRDVNTGWSTLDDPGDQEQWSPQMAPSEYSFAAGDQSQVAAMGREFTEAHLARARHVRQYADDLFDVYEESGDFYANAAFTDMVRSLDGDAHEYVAPVQFWSIPDEGIVDQTYTLIHVRRLVHTIDVERSRVDTVKWYHAIKEPPNHKPYFFNLKALTPEGRVVYRKALDAGLSIWRDRDTRALFCTEAFRARATEVGCRGLVFKECTVVDE